MHTQKYFKITVQFKMTTLLYILQCQWQSAYVVTSLKYVCVCIRELILPSYNKNCSFLAMLFLILFNIIYYLKSAKKKKKVNFG